MIFLNPLNFKNILHFGHSFGPSGLLDFVFHALRALTAGLTCRAHRLKIHIKCSEFGWVKNVTERRRVGGIPFYRVGIAILGPRARILFDRHNVAAAGESGK